MFRKRLYLATARYRAVVVCMNRAFLTELKIIIIIIIVIIIIICINVIIITITQPLFFCRISHRGKYSLWQLNKDRPT